MTALARPVPHPPPLKGSIMILQPLVSMEAHLLKIKIKQTFEDEAHKDKAKADLLSGSTLKLGTH